MGKTETIKQRRVDVYLPSLEAKERWTALAEEAGTSLSKFIAAVVEEALEEGGPLPDPQGLLEEVSALQSRLMDAEDRVRMLEALRDKLDAELRVYRARPFLEPGFEGVRSLDAKLIDLIRGNVDLKGKPKPLHPGRILERLGISPGEVEAAKAVNTQLEALVDYGLAESTPKGYRWCR